MPLNHEQRDVVMTLEENVLLAAPAGTGKTNTLAARIVRILDTGMARSEEILCLTFTNSGSQCLA